MKTLPYLLSKIMLFLMILTAPAMIAGNKTANIDTKVVANPARLPYYSSAVIKRFMNYRPSASPLYREGRDSRTVSRTDSETDSRTDSKTDSRTDSRMVSRTDSRTDSNTDNVADNRLDNRYIAKTSAASLELKTIINQATSLYDSMHLAYTGLNREAFEYAWRGYHNLLKKGLLNKTGVLSICDFSQSSHKKRLYVIDVRRKKLLFRTYVAHGQNSGAEYASSFSNIAESGKSSLGFYVTGKTYYGRNGLSLKIMGVDKGYNDQACKRNIVLHGSSYICGKYLRSFGQMGTSLGCPAIPAPLSPRIIRLVKNGSCLFIFHPTKKYLAESKVING